MGPAHMARTDPCLLLQQYSLAVGCKDKRNASRTIVAHFSSRKGNRAVDLLDFVATSYSTGCAGSMVRAIKGMSCLPLRPSMTLLTLFLCVKGF